MRRPGQALWTHGNPPRPHTLTNIHADQPRMYELGVLACHVYKQRVEERSAEEQREEAQREVMWDEGD